MVGNSADLRGSAASATADPFEKYPRHLHRAAAGRDFAMAKHVLPEASLHQQRGTLAADVRAPLAAVWRRLTAIFGGRYRPERHYMRGPGPKWQESHSPGPAQPKSKDPA
jgi:hypothetical protein